PAPAPPRPPRPGSPLVPPAALAGVPAVTAQFRIRPAGPTPREPLSRKDITAMDTRLSDYTLRLAAGAFTALGVVVVLVGYLGVRNESDVALQVPYLLSGGLGGLALVGLGALGLLQYQLRV